MRLRVALFLICICVVRAAAQQFTYVDWDVLQADTMPVQYCEVIPLADDYAAYNYHVTLDYPEYTRLTATESAKVAEWGSDLPEAPAVHTGVGVSRKQGVLDVSFIPIVRRDGKYYKLISFKMTITREAKPVKRTATKATSTSSSRYADSSVLATGTWVKIGITDDGVYRLTNSALKRMGFSDISRVKLYGYGGHVQDEVIDADNDFDDLEEIPLYRDDDGALFFGKGLLAWSEPNSSGHATHHSNTYANQACYFLTEGDDAQTLSVSSDGVSPTNNLDYTPANVLYKKEEYSWLQSGRYFYEATNYASSNSHTYTLATPDAVSTEEASLKVCFSSSSTSKTNTISIAADDATLGTFTISICGDYDEAKQSSRTYSLTSIGDQTEITITSTAGIPARLGYIELCYKRQLKMSDDFLYIRHTEDEASNFVIDTDGRSDVQLWRIGTRNNPACEMEGTLSGTVLTVPVADPSEEYVAVDVSASFPEPTYIGKIDNQNLHGTAAHDMVIIIPASGTLYDQAERLAQEHRDLDGLDVLTVSADQVYNEFSSGTPDATAYRRFMKMLYDRADSDHMPRYLLLFGDGLWDNRMLTDENEGKDPDDYLLCYESDNSLSHTSSFVMEDYFGLLDDGEGDDLEENKVDLGIGRFPVTTEDDAAIIVDKIIEYMENDYADAWKNVICVLGDDGDENDHIEKAERVAQLIEDEYPAMQVNRIYWDAYTRTTSTTGYSYPGVTDDVYEQMEEGCLMMNYTGHADARELSHELAITLSDFETFSSHNVPLWITAACDVSPFDMTEDNIGETAMLNPDGAAIAFYGTARTVYSSPNSLMNRYFTRYVLGRDNDIGLRNTIGDAVRLAKVALLTPDLSAKSDTITDYTENKLHYVLLGDPALKLGAPEYSLVISKINGQETGGDTTPNFSAGDVASVEGYVTDYEGNMVTDYTGTLTITVYDSETEVTCLNNDGDSYPPVTYYTRDKTLYTGKDSISGGTFSFTFPIPLDIKYTGESGRILLYAIDNNKTREANGYSEDVTVGGTGDNLTDDNDGPQITAYLNHEDFTDGETVNATPYFVAILEDTSGINVTGTAVGHDLELSIDNDPTTTYILNDYYESELGDYTKGQVAYVIPELSDGPHSLTFRAWDIMNNYSTVSFDFYVDSSLSPDLITLTCSGNPATTSTTFILRYDRPGSECNFLIEVFDYAGRKLYTHSEQGTSSTGIYYIDWDLTTSSGMPLSTGVYLYRATVWTDDSEDTSEANKIIILRNK